jgi:hypothetical protein
MQTSLQSFIELAFPDRDYSGIINYLEDNPRTISEFRRKINQITESFAKYGKNIYSR